MDSRRRSTKHYEYVQRLPDGGWGWVIVVAAFATNFVWGGLFNTYGILYKEFLNYFQEPRSYTSWIGSVLSGLGYATGIIASGLINKFGIRPVALAGAVLATISCFVSSFVNNVLGLIITFGCGVGLGHALSYTATYIIVPYYFERRRGLATGIAIAGSGVGNFVLAPVMRYLLSEYTWRGYMIIEAGIIFQCCVFAALYRPVELVKIPKEAKASLLDYDDQLVDQNKKSKALRDYRDRIASDATEYRHSKDGANKPIPYHPQKRESLQPSSRKVSKMQAVAFEIASHERARCHSVGVFDKEDWERFLRSDDCDKFKLLLVDAMHMSTNPFLRKDIFYASSLNKLPEYKTYDQHYSESILSIPKTIEAAVIPETILEVSEETFESFSAPPPNWCVRLMREIKETFGLHLLAKPEFFLYSMATFAFYFGYYVPTSVLYDYAIQLNFSKDQCLLMVSVMGIGNTVGRVGIGFFSDLRCVNRVVMFSVIMVIMGALNEACWLFPYGFAVVLTYAILFNIAVGAAKALFIVVAVDLMGIENLTNAYGLLLVFQGFGFLLGNPFAGCLYDISGSYALPFSILGGVLALSGLMTFLCPKIKNCNISLRCCQSASSP